MDLAKLFSLGYLFDLTLGPWQQYGFFVFSISLAIIALGVVIRIINQTIVLSEFIQRVIAKLSPFFITNGFLALFLWFARQQRMVFFSARFWWLVVFLIAIIWFFFIIRSTLRFRRNKRLMLEKRKVFQDYLPSKKK